MKKSISIILTIAMILAVAVVGVVPSYAVGISGTGVSYNFNNVTKTLTFSGSGAIPNYNDCYDENGNYNSKNSVPWKGIGYTSVEIEDGITGIGNYAFCKNSNLISVTIPDTVKTLGKGVFFDCDGLKSVEISNSVTTINDSTFSGCSSLYYVKAPNNLKEIKAKAFYKCSALTSISLPDSVTSIGESAFSNTGLKSFVCPAELTTIGVKAFLSCENLESVTFNNKLTSIGDSAFRYSALKKVEFPNSLNTIPSQVCSNCSSLEEIIIPESVEKIDDNAFYYCKKLKEVSIPFSVGLIGSKAFGYYSSSAKVADFKVKGYEDEDLPTAKKYADENGFEFVSLGKALEGTCGANVTWKLDKNTGTLTISGKGAIENYTSETHADYYKLAKLTKAIVIENGIASIGNYAFYGFENVTVSLSDCTTLKRIGDHAFYNITDSIYVSNSVTNLGEKCIGKFNAKGEADKNFTVISENFSSAKNYALENGFKFVIEDSKVPLEGTCGKDVTWKYNKDNSILTISGEGVMSDYTADKLPEYLYHYISGIVIEAGVTSIGDFAFTGADAVKEIYISPLVADIGDNAIGFAFDAKNAIVKVADLKIVSYDDTIAQLYAKENEFEFVSKGKYSGSSGGFGETATWSYNEKLKTLTISGTGETTSFTKETLPVFTNYDIEKIVIGEGITKISENSLLGLDGVKEITIANSVSEFGKNALGFSVKEGEIVKLEGVTINGYESSYAQLYAAENRFTFKSLGRFGILTGKCGEEAEWVYDSKLKSLTVSGKGATSDYTLENLPEFADFEIEDITVEDGITALGNFIFTMKNSSYERIALPNTITKLGEKAFGFTRTAVEPKEDDKESYDCIPMKDLDVSGFMVTPVMDYAKGNNFNFVARDEDRIDFGFKTLSVKIDQLNKIVFVYSKDVKAEKLTEDCTAKVKSVTVKTGEKLVLTENKKDFEYTLIIIGDVNADSNVNSSDALAILQHTVGLSKIEGNPGLAADVNNDSNINSSDALAVLQVTVGLVNMEDFNK